MSKDCSGKQPISLNLNPLNHAPVLLEPREREDAKTHLNVELQDEHAKIYDMFSHEQLDVLTQLSVLKFRENEKRQDLLSDNVDVDDPESGATLTSSLRGAYDQIPT